MNSFDELAELRAMVRSLFETRLPETEVRRVMETDKGFTDGDWRVLADLGLLGLAIPEQYGGNGAGLAEVAVLLEEAGRSLACVPLLSSVVMSTTLLLASDDTKMCAEILPALAAGRTRVAVALSESGHSWGPDEITTAAVLDGGNWSITGTKRFVVDGHSAGLLLVVCRTEAGIGIFAVDAGATGLIRERTPTLDQTRKQSHVTFTETPARLVGSADDGWAAVSHMIGVACVALAAEQVGGAQRVLEMAVDYAKTRVQFGRPIGAFQGIKHKCADILVEVEAARAAVTAAVTAQVHGTDGVPELANIAMANASDAFTHATNDNIQIHGGIGFTWEHSAHLYFKRARTSRVLLGDPAHHRQLIAQHIGL
jgi:alkylation response protein AidB-like acyl-CoA dehydrogenase